MAIPLTSPFNHRTVRNRPPACLSHCSIGSGLGIFMVRWAGNNLTGCTTFFPINWWDRSYNPWVLTINKWQFSCEYAVSNHETLGVLRQHVPVFVGPSQMHFSSIFMTKSATWWLIPLSKWAITPVISGLTLLIPFITSRVITHLLSGMNHQISVTDTIVPRFGDLPTISALCWALRGASEDAKSHPRPLRFGFNTRGFTAVSTHQTALLLIYVSVT